MPRDKVMLVGTLACFGFLFVCAIVGYAAHVYSCDVRVGCY